jgi:hypothetical protein
MTERSVACSALRQVAALYVDQRGPYPLMAGVECWDATRDARNYSGPHVVVAHPPCGPWGKLSHFSKQDPSLGPLAVEQVRVWGGVLEHPEHSRLWTACGLPKPGEFPDQYGGRSVAVDQCAYGHCTRKRTWLYVVGGSVPALRTGGVPTHAVCNGRGQVLADGTRRLRATALQARLTPPAFAELLVAIARSTVR